MRFSKFLCPTLREDPSEAETASHRLMLRGGMIRQVASGIYTLLPLGLRVIRKVETIVREEMSRAGAQEVFMPAVLPAELWKESGRWDVMGKELLRIKDRNEREFCFGPTHEEIITDLVRREIRSYRDLPRNFFQIQTKFRDEVRPRFGLMRCREFTMKDAYSFDINEEGAKASYDQMYEAYHRIFSRCGLRFSVVDADSGNIGGSQSQEFMVLADSGEDEIIRCPGCGYSANSEKADGVISKIPEAKMPNQMEKRETPGKSTVSDVASFLEVPEGRLIKTLIYKTDTMYLAVLLPGDREVNEIKLKSALQAQHLGLASAQEIQELTGGPLGFSGPVGLKIEKGKIERILVDGLIEKDESYVVGANEKDVHLVGVVAGKDFSMQEVLDLHRTREGDQCVKCQAVLQSDRGIEVGHIFRLGTKYSEIMQATFSDPKGELKPSIMGCYGIGIGRTAAAAIEQNHDARGVIFPPSLAPFDVAVIPVQVTNEDLKREGERLYALLADSGLDVLLDDREESAGAKFKDLDLMGIPGKITVGKKGLAQGKVEVKMRWQEESQFIDPSELVDWVRSIPQAWDTRSSKVA